MASTRASDSVLTAFLVERYLPPAAAIGLSASVSRLARLCADEGRADTDVQYVQSVYLPSEDTCFCVFTAISANAVRDVNREAGFALDRITDALLLLATATPLTPTRLIHFIQPKTWRSP